MTGVALLGAGRIGAVHAEKIARTQGASLRYVVDIFAEAAERIATQYEARPLADPAAAFADPEVDAVVIATATDTHVELIEGAAEAGKAIFSEKPIDLSIERAEQAAAAVQRAGVPFFPGLNRRFNPSFHAMHERVARGEIGRVETVTITSRDPRPPPIDYVRRSGGLFRDMSIHDFDMAHWLLGEEPFEVFASAISLVDPAIAEAGDVDTAVIVLRAASGALCTITNGRCAAYGYDQRAEVFGAEGLLRIENSYPTSVEHWSADGTAADLPFDFFLDRYRESYLLEIQHFIEAVASGGPLLEFAHDGLRALDLAEAAAESARTGKLVSVHERAA